MNILITHNTPNFHLYSQLFSHPILSPSHTGICIFQIHRSYLFGSWNKHLSESKHRTQNIELYETGFWFDFLLFTVQCPIVRRWRKNNNESQTIVFIFICSCIFYFFSLSLSLSSTSQLYGTTFCVCVHVFHFSTTWKLMYVSPFQLKAFDSDISNHFCSPLNSFFRKNKFRTFLRVEILQIIKTRTTKLTRNIYNRMILLFQKWEIR